MVYRVRPVDVGEQVIDFFYAEFDDFFNDVTGDLMYYSAVAANERAAEAFKFAASLVNKKTGVQGIGGPAWEPLSRNWVQRKGHDRFYYYKGGLRRYLRGAKVDKLLGERGIEFANPDGRRKAATTPLVDIVRGGGSFASRTETDTGDGFSEDSPRAFTRGGQSVTPIGNLSRDETGSNVPGASVTTLNNRRRNKTRKFSAAFQFYPGLTRTQREGAVERFLMRTTRAEKTMHKLIGRTPGRIDRPLLTPVINYYISKVLPEVVEQALRETASQQTVARNARLNTRQANRRATPTRRQRQDVLRGATRTRFD